MQTSTNFHPQVGADVFTESNHISSNATWSSFPILWRTINEVCMQAFSVLENHPTKDLSVLYRELNANLCRAHAFVYKLTAYPCQDCPSLVRGSNSARVVGDNQECTQVLVVYYLFREILKKQALQSKQSLSAEHYSISSYLDTFEKYSAGVNVIKCVFTYLQWVWQKVGLPSEHSILPTEVIYLHMWTEHILTEDVRENLKLCAMDTVNKMRQANEVDYGTIENVKRMALNLSMFTDSRQPFYVSILEDPFLSSMSNFYLSQKETYKRFGPERYVNICVRALKREEFLVKCCLCKQSLEKVRSRMVDILFHEEIEFLRLPFKASLASDLEDGKNRDWLSNLYVLLAEGSKSSWIEEVITSNVSEETSKLISHYVQADENNTPATAALNAIRETHHSQKRKILQIFGPKGPLLVAMLLGFKIGLDLFRKSYGQTKEDCLDSVADSLAVFAAKEAGSSCPGSNIGHNWIADIYGLMEEKEVFHTKYVKLLESRLLKNVYITETSVASQDAFRKEQQMLTDLFSQGKNFDFAHSCQIKLKDVYMRNFNYKPITEVSFELHPIVLNKFIWDGLTVPLKQDTKLLTNVVNQTLDHFYAVYKEKIAPGKCLVFLPHYSSCIVRMKTDDLPDGMVHLILSTLQLRIANAFNQKTSWSLTDLEAWVGVNQAEFTEHLNQFIKANIFSHSSSGKIVSVCTPIRLNRKRIFLVPDMQHEYVRQRNKDENTGSTIPIQREKAIAIEACIVKSLKTYGCLSIEEIEGFVSKDLERFNIDRRDIKKILDKLIEREYVVRESNSKTFKFIP